MIIKTVLFQYLYFCVGLSLLGFAYTSPPDKTDITNPVILSIQPDNVDWLTKLANSIISREPDAGEYPWNWGEGILMYGVWKVYEETGSISYLNYVKSFIDTYVDVNGNVTSHIQTKTYTNGVSCAILLPYLYTHTNDSRYLTAANIVADYVFNDCPRTSEGALVHRNDELWDDTIPMICIFFTQMGCLTGEDRFFNEAANQIILHADKLQDSSEKLFYHGWDENGSSDWADPVTHQSPCFWARGNGWIVMSLIDLLEYIPDTHPQKNTLVDIFQNLVSKVIENQDPVTGLWYTVIDQGSRSGNYLETSASAMFVYSIQKGIIEGYIDVNYQENVNKGNQGLNTRIYEDGTGLSVVTGISVGTIVGDYDYYVSRQTEDNLTWGLGAFLMAKTFFRPQFSPNAVSNLCMKSTGNNLLITWSPVKTNIKGGAIAIDHYKLYRASDVTFTPNVTDSISGITDTSFVDNLSGVVGNPSENYFYRVKAIDKNGLSSELSSIIGEFDFDLITTSATDFNEIALPLIVSGITTAQQLMESIPGCNSVAYWNAAFQGYKQYIPAVPSSNFDISSGHPYYVNITKNGVFTLIGEIAATSFNLITTSKTNFNEIVIPLDKTNITKASELIADILNCNSIAWWNAQNQEYEQYIPDLPITDFTVRPGYPYYVNVTENVTWPEGGTPKSTGIEPEIIQEGASHAPHIVWGCINIEENYRSTKEIKFTAFIKDRPDEKLYENSPGCMIKDQYCIVQCAAFPSPWRAGEILKILFRDKKESFKIEREIILTYEPADEVGEIIISESEALPTYYSLNQNYPNPFNHQTIIKYQIPENDKVIISIYNVNGQKIRTLINEEKESGYYKTVWYAIDDFDNEVPSGNYFVKMECGSFVQTIKIILIK